MSTYQETLTQHLRLCLLRLLLEAPSNEANNSILTDSVGLYGLAVSRDQVNTALAWLAEQQLIQLETVSSTITVARLRNRGVDVAEGKATVPGVKRRLPGD